MKNKHILWILSHRCDDISDYGVWIQLISHKASYKLKVPWLKWVFIYFLWLLFFVLGYLFGGNGRILFGFWSISLEKEDMELASGLQMVFLRHGDAVIERKANNFERESNWTNEREIDGLILVQVDYDKNGWMVRSKVEKKLVHYRPILQWVQAKRIPFLIWF